MTEEMQKDIKFYRETVNINEVAIAWLAFNVCVREIVVDANKHPRGFRFWLKNGKVIFGLPKKFSVLSRKRLLYRS